MLSQSTLVKIAVGIVAVLLIFCLIKMKKCKHRQYNMPPVVTAIPVPPEKFAPYEPEEDDEEDYADYVPPEEQAPVVEDYVDASDVYAAPDSSTHLLS